MKYYLGIDLGGTNIVAGIVNIEYEIIAKASIPTKAERSFEKIVEDMAAVARNLLLENNIPETAIEYVGIGTPSNINPENRHLMFANNLGWFDRDLRGEFQKHWKIPVLIANDADAAALGEVFAGSAKDYNDAMMITIGTGIGGGLIIAKKIYCGGDGFGCEFGHVPLIMNGFPCSCGNKGCFEAYGSITALIRETISYMKAFPKSLMWEECGRDLNKVDGRTSFDAAKKGDEAAKMVFENFVDYLAYGISGFINSLRPSVIIIGGGISKEGDFLLDPIRKQVNEIIIAPELITPPSIIAATLGGDAGVVGAAMLGL